MNKDILTEIGITDETILNQILELNAYEVQTAKVRAKRELEEERNYLSVHCKPCYNFQSIEFDYELDLSDDDDLETFKDIYNKLYNVIKECAPEDSKTTKNVEVLSDSQKALMKKLGLKYTDNMPMEEARLKIKKALEK